MFVKPRMGRHFFARICRRLTGPKMEYREIASHGFTPVASGLPLLRSLNKDYRALPRVKDAD
jgi:hypothetical protein